MDRYTKGQSVWVAISYVVAEISMLKLYPEPETFNEVEIQNKTYRIHENRVLCENDGNLLFEAKIDEKKAEWCFPFFGPLIAVADLYVILYSECEHSRGASMHEQAVEVINIENKKSFSIKMNFTHEVIFQSPDKNPESRDLHFLHFINGIYAYNNEINSGKPCLELDTVTLPSGAISNRMIIEIPNALKKHYNSENISYLKAKLINKDNKIFAICNPVSKAGVSEKLDFETELPLISQT